MGGILKIEISHEKNILEVYESEPDKLNFVMYPDDPKSEVWLNIEVSTEEFKSLLRKLIGDI